MILELKSVGCVIDTETCITYSKFSEQGKEWYGKDYDDNDGVHLFECIEDWVDKLSDEDVVLINENCLIN